MTESLQGTPALWLIVPEDGQHMDHVSLGLPTRATTPGEPR